MATAIDSAALKPSNSTTALFRAWVQFIEDILVAGGWIVTADTGQANISTLAVPTATNQKMGYRIYRMADTLQATKPVFMKLEFGGSSTAGANPAVWVTLGEATDGAGNVTSIRYNGGAVATPTFCTAANITTGTYNSYASAGNNRVSIGLFIGTTPGRILFFTLERTKDASGADTGVGLIMSMGEQSFGVYTYCIIVVMGGGTQPPLEQGVNYVLSSNNPSAFGGDVGVGIPIPILAIAQPPGLNAVLVRANDYAVEASFSVTIYGVSHVYQHLNSYPSARWVGSSVTDSTARLCMRYE